MDHATSNAVSAGGSHSILRNAASCMFEPLKVGETKHVKFVAFQGVIHTVRQIWVYGNQQKQRNGFSNPAWFQKILCGFNETILFKFN